MADFSDGILDRLFGRRLTVTMSDQAGHVITHTVTQKWLNKQKKKGTIQLQKTTTPSEMASDLFHAASANAIAAFEAYRPRLAFLASVDLEQWRFFGTVAAVQGACIVMRNRIGDEFGATFAAIYSFAEKWDHQGPTALTDCLRFVIETSERLRAAEEEDEGEDDEDEDSQELEHEDEADARRTQYCLGLWVLWNVLGRKPSSDEASMLAPALGMSFYTLADAVFTH
jgi:class 3 adenylate cyclase